MTRGVRKQYGLGLIPGESASVVIGGVPSFAPTNRPTNGIVYCHGSGETVAELATDAAELPIRDVLGRIGKAGATVVAADMGGDLFGNDDQIARVHACVTYLRDEWGVTGKVGLFGGSMGNTTALNYAHAHPEEVAYVAGFIPLVDVNLAYTTVPSTVAPIDAAYPPNWSLATDGPDHDPTVYSPEGLPTDLPIKLWYATNDTIVAASSITAFQAARPWTEIEEAFPGGHSFTSLDAATADSMVEWVTSHFA